MSRIRSIKPQFCTSEQVTSCSRDARLLFILMWTFCDDWGVHPDNVGRLKMECFPGDDDVGRERIAHLVDELLGAGLLARYTAGAEKFLFVTGWAKHQKVDHPNEKARFPGPREDSRTFANDRDGSRLKGVESIGEEEDSKGEDSHTAAPRELPLGDRASVVDLAPLVVNLWNEMAERAGLDRVKKITPPRQQAAMRCVRDVGGLEAVRAMFERVGRSRFLRGLTNGKGHPNWKGADFDWVLRPENCVKICEGNYDDKQHPKAGGGDHGRPASLAELGARAELEARGGDR